MIFHVVIIFKNQQVEKKTDASQKNVLKAKSKWKVAQNLYL